MSSINIKDLETAQSVDKNDFIILEQYSGTKKVKARIFGDMENQEVVEARGENSSLKERLGKFDTRLFENTNKINDSKFYLLDYDGTDSEKYLSAINDLRNNNGGILILPQGEFTFSNVPLSNNIIIEGQGIGKTVIKQESNSNVFNGGDKSYNNITIKNLSIIGTAESHKTQIPESGRPIIIKRSKNVIVSNVQIKWFAGLGLSILDSYNVNISNNIVEHIGRDGINCAGCKNVIIADNNINHVGDDAIAVHDASNQTLYVPQNIQGVTITGNTIYNSNGIGCVGAQQYTISNNTLKFIRGTGIFVGYSGDVNNETQIKANIISNNVITDIFDIADCCGIKISGGNVNADVLKTVKVETLKGNTNFISNNFIISNNIISQTMENLDYNTNWNLLDNWTLPYKIIYGIRLYGMMREININGNNISRCQKAIQYYTDDYENIKSGIIENLLICNNIITRSNYGYYHTNKNTDNKLNIVINGNIFDLDTYMESPLRNTTGGWTNKTDSYTAIYVTGVKQFPITNNIFRNVSNICCYGMICADNNIIDVNTCYDYSNFDFNGEPYGAEKSWINSNRNLYKWSNSAPTQGKWFKSDKVYNTDTRPGLYIGWVCVQSGEFGTTKQPIFKGFGLIQN